MMNDTIGSLMHSIRFWLRNEDKVQAELKPFADKFDEMKERIAQLEAVRDAAENFIDSGMDIDRVDDIKAALTALNRIPKVCLRSCLSEVL